MKLDSIKIKKKKKRKREAVLFGAIAPTLGTRVVRTYDEDDERVAFVRFLTAISRIWGL